MVPKQVQNYMSTNPGVWCMFYSNILRVSHVNASFTVGNGLSWKLCLLKKLSLCLQPGICAYGRVLVLCFFLLLFWTTVWPPTTQTSDRSLRSIPQHAVKITEFCTFLAPFQIYMYSMYSNIRMLRCHGKKLASSPTTHPISEIWNIVNRNY